MRRKVLKWILGVFAVLVIGLAIWIGPLAIAIYRNFVNPKDAGPEEYSVQYEGSLTENLKAVYQALELVHESEGAYPPAAEWMDQAIVRLRTHDLIPGEEFKKLMDPAVGRMPNPYRTGMGPTAGGAWAFGLAFNEEFAGKYKEDVAGYKDRPLIFVSKDSEWNAAGRPSDLAPAWDRTDRTWGITADGRVITLEQFRAGSTNDSSASGAPQPNPPTR